jgi:S-adenosylmethionine hydrolase
VRLDRPRDLRGRTPRGALGRRGGEERGSRRSHGSGYGGGIAGPFVTLLTDFGLEDDFAGQCRGVIKRIAPEADILDITHGIPPQRVLQGALALASTLPYMPVGIHVAVVDPGVGGQRKALALRGGDGRLYVGPDNGLLLLAVDELGGVEEAIEIANPEYMLPEVSRTFHGRDVFCPVAAHLALGVPLADLGTALDPLGLVRLSLPEPHVAPGRARGTILAVDRFGNVELNLTRADLSRAGLEPGAVAEVAGTFEGVFAHVAETFGDVRPGDFLLFEDSHRRVAFGINGGNAAELLQARPGQFVELLRADVHSRE